MLGEITISPTEWTMHKRNRTMYLFHDARVIAILQKSRRVASSLGRYGWGRVTRSKALVWQVAIPTGGGTTRGDQGGKERPASSPFRDRATV